MTDLTAARPRGLDVTGDAARARVARRYRAERRFKAYGIAAVAFSALFIVLLMADVIVKAVPAFTQSVLRLEVPVTAEALGVQNLQDPAALAGADYLAPIRTQLQTSFPQATDRASRRVLFGLLSSAAGDPLRRAVVDDPGLIGQTVPAPVPLSDDADLYLKGRVTPLERRPAQGVATPSATTGTVTISSSAGDFGDDLAELKGDLAQTARALRFEAERLTRVRAGIEEELGPIKFALGNPTPQGRAALEGEAARLTADLESLERGIKDRIDRAAALDARFNASSAAESLDATLPSLLIAINGGLVKVTSISGSQAGGEVLLPLQSTESARPEAWRTWRLDVPEGSRKISDREIAYLERLRETGLVEQRFNWSFLTNGDSREAELAGILGALAGSALTMLVTLVICLPVGVGAAIYLQEFAPKNRITDIIEVNINNLAAVPSIVFGLLGLAVFLNFFGMPRSAPLVGGLVLALLVLPTIIIASRAALAAVPPSIREAALGVGASHQQAVFHHVLPLAMPGILTGTIIGMAHALGETAPLLMIGMVAFIVDVPGGITDSATALPVQIYLWSDLPEVLFQAKTAAAILVLLAFLFVMNGMAIFLRRRFERRW